MINELIMNLQISQYSFYDFEVYIINGFLKQVISNTPEFLVKILELLKNLSNIYKPEKLSKFWADSLINTNNSKIRIIISKIFEEVLLKNCAKELIGLIY